ncbi:hypothetical protein B5C26_17635 [Photorhabdus luminescens]|uniref:Uncharacterized protein n=1 Tax=Photorhabdus luminescens subsp. mexicana TaxID=2100167 RepID=A0A4R4JKQ2_PHOLU|nr:hypothetical protein [Photorhabdus luminescens]OWO80604.1 hypothetical protein B5C26_17635 [Photorhabdus luminescens]TDB54352.1 hypothetical protein C5468_04070 [Photorhabdus luminescens subsp. mexicana]
MSLDNSSDNSPWSSYDPNTVIYYKILNGNYNTLNNVKVRLEGASDKTLVLEKGQSFVLNFVKASDGSYYFKYSGAKVQQVDFNDGGSGDDLTFPGYSSNPSSSTVVTYNSGDILGNIYDVLQLRTHEYINKFDDVDGVDGGPAAKFTQSVQGNTLVLQIDYK